MPQQRGADEGEILTGHFLLRREAAQRAGIEPEEVRQRPDLLRIGGDWIEEVYFEFQFDGYGIRDDLGGVVRELRSRYSDIIIADWLSRPNEVLSGTSPLRWVVIGGSAAQLNLAAMNAGPGKQGAVRA